MATHLQNSFDNLSKFFDNYTLGFESLPSIASQMDTTYPPYNLRKIDERKYCIELAIAGFTKEEIDITEGNNSIIITGEKSTEDSGSGFIHKGIANRKFKRTFAVAPSIEIKEATLENGILKISLADEREAEVKKIPIL